MVTIPKMSFLNNFLLQNEADKLFSVFFYLQQKSVASNFEQKLFFDLNDNSYFFIDENNKKHVNKFPDVIKFGFLKNSYGPPSYPTKLIDTPVSFKNDKELSVKFFNDGKIQSGSVYLIDKNQKFMMAVTSPIAQVSYFRKYKYQNGNWSVISNN